MVLSERQKVRPDGGIMAQSGEKSRLPVDLLLPLARIGRKKLQKKSNAFLDAVASSFQRFEVFHPLYLLQ